MRMPAGNRSSWAEQPYTKAFKGALEEQVQMERTLLYAACRKSTDADVRGAFQRMVSLEEMIEDMDAKKGK